MTDSRLFPPLSLDTRKAFEALERAVNEAAPLGLQARRLLPDRIRDVWRSLTSEREARTPLYLAKPEFASAYIRYFFPWNLYRFSRLFAALDLRLDDGSVVVDMGSGPLTVVIALWITRPELRAKKLTVYAVDRAGASLDAGVAALERIAVDLSGEPPRWKIVKVKERFGASIKERADLFTAAFMLNELAEHNRKGFAEQGRAYFRALRSYLKPDGRILLLEPGVPRSGALLSAIRDAALGAGHSVLAPCPHADSCPMPGPYIPDNELGDRRAYGNKRTPWCHFTFDSDGAPEWLLSISRAAKLEKADAALSFLYLSMQGDDSRTEAAKTTELPQASVRTLVVSSPFSLPSASQIRVEGRYACTHLGYCLIKSQSGSSLKPGDRIDALLPVKAERDPKTGARVLYEPGFQEKVKSERTENDEDAPRSRSLQRIPERSPGKRGKPTPKSKNPRPKS